MPNIIDLQNSEITSHWEKADNEIFSIIVNMESKEKWTLDDNENINDALVKWALSLTEDRVEQIVENDSDSLIRIIAFMKSKRAFYFLEKLEKNNPGVMSEILHTALDGVERNKEDIRIYEIFRDRLVALFRVDLLERLFSINRTEKIKLAIIQSVEKYGGIHG